MPPGIGYPQDPAIADLMKPGPALPPAAPMPPGMGNPAMAAPPLPGMPSAPMPEASQTAMMPPPSTAQAQAAAGAPAGGLDSMVANLSPEQSEALARQLIEGRMSAGKAPGMVR
jgi:hypothetical protein